jgi:carnosine N-methyltransferase
VLILCALAGYATQGNEFSYQMLFASEFLLNWCVGRRCYWGSMIPGHAADFADCVRRVTQAGAFEIHPWIHDPSNALSVTDMLRPVAVPDVTAAEVLGLDRDYKPDFSMCAGEFLEAYANDKGTSIGREAAIGARI